MESPATRTRGEVGFLSGFGAHIRALTARDVELHKLNAKMQGHQITDCVAVEGEDLARDLAAIVDMRSGTLVWSEIPRPANTEKGYEMAPIPDAEERDFVLGTSTLVRLLFPEIEMPD